MNKAAGNIPRLGVCVAAFIFVRSTRLVNIYAINMQSSVAVAFMSARARLGEREKDRE